MSKAALDASALLALLNNEPGAEAVEQALPGAAISAVNLAEVSARLSALGMPLAEIRRVVGLLGVEVAPFDEDTALESGALYPLTHTLGLSLGDRACLAFASRSGRTAVTADRAWAGVQAGVTIQVIR